MAQETEEGWYTDPYGRHEARWMSAGSPTKLVRDGGVESYENPPDEAPSHPATKIVEEPRPGSDVRRADEADAEPLPSSGKFMDVAVFGAVSSWHRQDHDPREHR